VGAFTLRFPVRADATTRQRDDVAGPGTRAGDRWSTPEPRTERIVPDERLPPSPALGALPAGLWAAREHEETAGPVEVERPRRRAVRWAALAAMLGVAVLGVTALTLHAQRAAGGHAPSVPPAPPPAASPTSSTASPVISAPAAPSVSNGSAVALDPRSSRSAQPGIVLPRAAIAASSAAAAAAPADDCAGEVAFYSNDAWVIRGGPSTVESPAKNLVWRCGTFNLVAHSRFDPTQVKSTTISVSPKRRAVWDLR
jgi:hypothetical protein